MAITLSLFVRRTCITFSHVVRNVPSIPLTSIAFTSILVKRNGTYTTLQTGKILSNKKAMSKSHISKCWACLQEGKNILWPLISLIVVYEYKSQAWTSDFSYSILSDFKILIIRNHFRIKLCKFCVTQSTHWYINFCSKFIKFECWNIYTPYKNKSRE